MKKSILLLSIFVFLLTCVCGSVSAADETVVFEAFHADGSLTGWVCEDGVTASYDAAQGAVKFSAGGISGPKRVSYTGGDIVFSKKARYRVSYETMSPAAGSYFLGIELNTGGTKASWQLSPNGSGSSGIYDNTYRGGGSNGTSGWGGVSYDFTVYDIKNDAGASIDSITIPANKLFFQLNTATDYYIKNFKIEKIPFAQQGNSLVNTVFEDHFDEASLADWSATGGELTAENGALQFVGSGRFAYKGRNLKFGSNTKYRVSYRTKMISDKAYFMGLEVHAAGQWRLGENEAFTSKIYDNSIGYRGSAKNGSEDWTDVSYEITMYELQNTAGEAIDSITVPANLLFFNLPYADTTFSIDELKIEEIIENVGVSYDSAMGTVSIDGASVANGGRVTAAKATVSAEAKPGYLFSKFTVTDKAGETVEYPGLDRIDLAFDTDSTVTAVFEAAPAPSVTERKILTDQYNNENSILVFSAVSAQGNTVSEFGVELKKAGGAEILRLKGVTEISETNNLFGIRAYGRGIQPGTYEARVYAVINGEMVTGEWKTVVIS